MLFWDIKIIVKPFSTLPTWFRKSVWAFFLGIGLFIGAYFFLHWRSIRTFRSTQASVPTVEVSPSQSSPLVDKNDAFQVAVGDGSLTKTPKYGHLPYTEANTSDLIVVSSFGLRENQRFERLHQDAAFALMQMTNTARDEGVWIVLLSAFREFDRQSELFSYQIQKKGSPEEAAKSSAPPGYSEHHTGYAMDLGDGHTPDSDINQDFSNTQAFIWLLQRAGEFGFELSFPVDNSQGVSYEPWHWRFTGSAEAQAVFSQATSSEG